MLLVCLTVSLIVLLVLFAADGFAEAVQLMGEVEFNPACGCYIKKEPQRVRAEALDGEVWPVTAPPYEMRFKEVF